MDMLYAAIEERLKEAINTYNTCKKPNKSTNARESHVPYERLLDRQRPVSESSNLPRIRLY